MPKRDPDIEPVEDIPAEAEVPTVGERLRAAREQKGLSLEDVAAQTRIPQRHLASIERADWESLPTPTYTIGFAKSYAGVVGLDRTDIGDQLRDEMGGQRITANAVETFEPAHPRRTVGGEQRGRVDLEMVGGLRRDIGSGYRGLYPLALSRPDAAALLRMGA